MTVNFAPALSQAQIAAKLRVLDRVAGRQSSEFAPPEGGDMAHRRWHTSRDGTEALDQADLRQSGASPFGDCEAGPLGNSTDLHSAPPNCPLYAISEPGPDGLKVTRDAKRWLARAHGRRLLWASGNGRRRPAACGLRLQHGRKAVEVYRCPDGPRGRVVGPCSCGQPLICPVCSPRISSVRAGEVGDGFRRASARAWRAHLMVFTAPHTAASPLLAEVDFWRGAWEEFMASGRASQKLKDQRKGHIGGPELTHGLNGWHFHRNLVVFHDGNLDVEAHKSRWMGCLGSRYSLAAEKHAFDAKEIDDEDMAIYCAKHGAEVAWAEGKTSSQTALTLLVRSALAGRSCPEWVEAVNVVAARKLSILRWSRGLRAELGIAPEKTDVEIAEEKGRPSDELLGSVTATQWRLIVSRRLEYRLLQEANLGREALECFMHSNGLGDLLSPEQIAGAFPVFGSTVT